MALHATAQSVQANAGGSTFAVTMPTISVGDHVYVMLNSDGASQSLTAPGTGYWTQIKNNSMAGPDGETIQLYGRIADGTEGSTQSWGIAGKGIVAIAASFSGRSSSLITSTNVSVTTSTASNTTPVSASLTGLTASANDDLFAFIALDVTAAGPTWTASTITNYTARQTANSGDAAIAMLQTRDNVSAGATGSLSTTLTRTAGSGNTGYTAYVVNIPIASGVSVAALTANQFRLRRLLAV